MDGVKYSLKTNKFSKRKHIFDKSQSSDSLLIHEPSSDTNLREMNKTHVTWNNSSNVENSRADIPVPLDLSWTKQSQLSKQTKNVNGNISSRQKQTGSPEVLSEMIWVRNLLLKNEERINLLTDSFNTIIKNTTNLYQNHAKHLRGIVSERCRQFTVMLSKVLIVFEKKNSQMEALDHRVNLFTNTLRESKESLRLVSLKQQCLQLQANKKNTITLNQSISETKKSAQREASEPLITEIGFEFLSERKSGKNKKEQSNFSSSPVIDWEDLNVEEKGSMKETYFFHNQIKSPLQTFDEQWQDNSFISRDIDKNKYDQLKQKLKGENKQIWLDELNCLRSKHGGYLLDSCGNALICSKQTFDRLCKEGYIHKK